MICSSCQKAGNFRFEDCRTEIHYRCLHCGYQNTLSLQNVIQQLEKFCDLRLKLDGLLTELKK